MLTRCQYNGASEGWKVQVQMVFANFTFKHMQNSPAHIDEHLCATAQTRGERGGGGGARYFYFCGPRARFATLSGRKQLALINDESSGAT